MVTMGYRGDYGDVLVYNTGGFTARESAHFLAKPLILTYIDKLTIVKKFSLLT